MRPLSPSGLCVLFTLQVFRFCRFILIWDMRKCEGQNASIRPDNWKPRAFPPLTFRIVMTMISGSSWRIHTGHHRRFLQTRLRWAVTIWWYPLSLLDFSPPTDEHTNLESHPGVMTDPFNSIELHLKLYRSQFFSLDSSSEYRAIYGMHVHSRSCISVK